MDDYSKIRKNDAKPILASGVRVIGEWQLDHFFYDSFTGTSADPSRRLFLVNNLRRYLHELRKLNLYIEVWIDGSFVTNKLDPSDIDLTVFVHGYELDTLPVIHKQQLTRLTNDPDLMLARYTVHGFLAYLEDESEKDYWDGLFSKGHYTNSEKGYFKIIIPHV
ncbi:DUF6932 family protein [Spirosoma flavum]|uniref:DUF6932 family protein n=1 Tax=Spirosoma flavum TaxID=2048557 RepID=A0ABW6AV34_9BACT